MQNTALSRSNGIYLGITLIEIIITRYYNFLYDDIYYRWKNKFRIEISNIRKKFSIIFKDSSSRIQ